MQWINSAISDTEIYKTFMDNNIDAWSSLFLCFYFFFNLVNFLSCVFFGGFCFTDTELATTVLPLSIFYSQYC